MHGAVILEKKMNSGRIIQITGNNYGETGMQ